LAWIVGMARKLRLEYLAYGAIYHVMNRGDQCNNIVRNDQGGAVAAGDDDESGVGGQMVAYGH